MPIATPSQRQRAQSFLSLDGTTTVHYWEYLPAGDADDDARHPLLVFFHGSGETGAADGSQLGKVKAHGPPKLIEAGHDMCFDTPSGRRCFIVVSPQNSRDWWDIRDRAGMFAHALQTYRVDPKRVYVTGLSMGGGATWNLASASVAGSSPAEWWASRIAAIVPVCGAADPARANAGICEGIVGTHLPVWAFHGSADTVVPAETSRRWIGKINATSSADGHRCTAGAANPAARLTLYRGVGHDSWTATYDPVHQVEPGRNVYEWMLQHER